LGSVKASDSTESSVSRRVSEASFWKGAALDGNVVDEDFGEKLDVSNRKMGHDVKECLGSRASRGGASVEVGRWGT